MRALYDFAPTESGELAFAKGDIIRVLDSVYEHWWRGELKGEAGIFPVNYVVSRLSKWPAEDTAHTPFTHAGSTARSHAG